MMLTENLAGVKAQAEVVRFFPSEIRFGRFFQTVFIKTGAIVSYGQQKALRCFFQAEFDL